jgi:cystathionine gamma-synthase
MTEKIISSKSSNKILRLSLSNENNCNLENSMLTTAVHGGTPKNRAYRPLALPEVASTNFIFESTNDIHRFNCGELPYEYGRYGSPTVNGCEERLAALEGTESALLFASGMCAFTTTLLALLKSGDHIIIGNDSYKRLRLFCTNTLVKFGISTTVVPMDDLGIIEEAILPNTKLMVFEVPTNPFLRVVDIPKLGFIAKQKNILLLIDATLATPINVQPALLGADIIVHSATKYLGGHNDLLCGVVAGCSAILSEIRTSRDMYGGISDAHSAVKLERSLKTLAIRIKQQNSSALAIANFLESHPLVEKVWYPLLPSHSQYELSKSILKGGGGVVSFTIAGNCEDTCSFIDSLKIPLIADSLGGTDSLVKHVALMSFFKFSESERAQFGITDNLVRYSVGIEDGDDLINDLEKALNVLGQRLNQNKLLRA